MKPVCIGNVLLEKSKKFFLNLLDSNTTKVVKDIFIFPTEDITKKITFGRKKMLTLQKPVQILKKKFRILIQDKFLGKVTKFRKIWMSY